MVVSEKGISMDRWYMYACVFRLLVWKTPMVF